MAAITRGGGEPSRVFRVFEFPKARSKIHSYIVAWLFVARRPMLRDGACKSRDLRAETRSAPLRSCDTDNISDCVTRREAIRGPIRGTRTDVPGGGAALSLHQLPDVESSETPARFDPRVASLRTVNSIPRRERDGRAALRVSAADVSLRAARGILPSASGVSNDAGIIPHRLRVVRARSRLPSERPNGSQERKFGTRSANATRGRSRRGAEKEEEHNERPNRNSTVNRSGARNRIGGFL